MQTFLFIRMATGRRGPDSHSYSGILTDVGGWRGEGYASFFIW